MNYGSYGGPCGEFINVNGMETPIKPKTNAEHKIQKHQLWDKFLKDLEKLKQE